MRTTLRAQIALVTGTIALLVVALAGAILALGIDHRDRSTLDKQLETRADRLSADVGKLLSGGSGSQQPGPDGYGDLLDGSESLVRVVNGSQVVAQRGAVPEQAAPLPTSEGFGTLRIDGAPWRSYVVAVPGGYRIQLLQTMEPVNQRRDANARLVLIVTTAAALISGGVGWLLSSVILRPLRRLADGAVAIADDPDPSHRLPEVRGPTEVSALSTTLNGMLDRLGTNTETTRRFAADVGHELRGPLTASGTYLETLLAVPDLPPADVRSALTAVQQQQHRMVSTLNALQILARADAGALPSPTEVEPGLLTEELVRLARQHHPEVTYTVQDTSHGATVSGWPDGLRIAIGNLLENAAIHGRPRGHIQVGIDHDGDWLTIQVEDDGPGIPEHWRTEAPKRFTRGPTTAPGSGLGLALVDQQATLHRGSLHLGAADSGGLCARVTLPTSTSDSVSAGD